MGTVNSRGYRQAEHFFRRARPYREALGRAARCFPAPQDFFGKKSKIKNVDNIRNSAHKIRNSASEQMQNGDGIHAPAPRHGLDHW